MHLVTTKTKRKFLVYLFVFLAVFSTTWGILMKPKPVEAAWPVANILQGIIDTVEAKVFPTIVQTIKQFVVKFAYNDLMKWISGEKGGKPAFITDFDDWLFTQADWAASSVLEQVAGTGFTAFCTGINANLSLYWKPLFENKYYQPKCTLSQIQQRFQNPGTKWVDFQASLNGSNNDIGFLFEVFSKASETKDDLTLQHFLQGITGYDKSIKDKDGKEKVLTPGAQISAFVNGGVNSIWSGATNSDAWQDFFGPLIDASIQGALKRGVNTFNSLNKNK